MIEAGQLLLPVSVDAQVREAGQLLLPASVDAQVREAGQLPFFIIF